MPNETNREDRRNFSRAIPRRIPAEVVYFGLLAICLHHNGIVPRGWYWRSFEHHHLLSVAQKWLVLPAFFLGALCFLLIVMGIILVLLAATMAAFGS